MQVHEAIKMLYAKGLLIIAYKTQGFDEVRRVAKGVTGFKDRY